MSVWFFGGSIRRSCFFAIAAVLALSIFALPAMANPRVKRGQYIIQKSPLLAARKAKPESQRKFIRKKRILGKVGDFEVLSKRTRAARSSGSDAVEYNADRAASDCSDIFDEDPAVISCEPDFEIKLDVTPNDSSYDSLWGMDMIKAPQAWNTTTGSTSVIVAVVDTGIDYDHVDLAANMWVNPGEIAGNGIDDDANGVIDDVYGFNAITDGGDPDDDHGHGSHCAGTIGAVGNNSTGVAGVNWTVKLMAVKFLDSDGSGWTSDSIEAVDYAVANGAKVINASYGGGSFSSAVQTSIQNASAAGVIFAAAAGNDGLNNDVNPHYPSSYDVDNIIAVGSSDSSDGRSSFSNYGAGSVDVFAPGSGILSTLPGNTYASWSGTSMATPHVSGLAALLIGAFPSENVAQIKARIMNYGDSVSAFSGISLSGKRINALAALSGSTPPASGGGTGTVYDISVQGEHRRKGYKLNKLFKNQPFQVQVTTDADESVEIILDLKGFRSRYNSCSLGTFTADSEGIVLIEGTLLLQAKAAKKASRAIRGYFSAGDLEQSTRVMGKYKRWEKTGRSALESSCSAIQATVSQL